MITALRDLGFSQERFLFKYTLALLTQFETANKHSAYSRFLLQAPAILSDAISTCGQTGDLVYAPSDLTQNSIMKAALTAWVKDVFKIISVPSEELRGP